MKKILLILLSVFMISCTKKAETPVPVPEKVQYPAQNNLLIPAVNKVKDNVFLENENVGGMEQSLLTQKVKDMAKGVNKEPQNAIIDTNKWTVSGSAKSGKIINEDATIKAVMEAKEGDKINLVIEEKQGLTQEQLKANIIEIGSYTTKLIDKDESRIKNINLASKKIDYKKLKPNETFSFNGVVGVRSEAKGYEEAPIIIQTEEGPKKENGLGGGICQISTTLYNAAVKAGLEIVERHEHSKDINYVPKGKDATVSYGGVDLKFKNIKEHPLMIRVTVNNNTLTVRILENRNW